MLAQTNLQLYRQLDELGWEHSDLARVGVAYELACTLFAGRYRASGKTFVAHCIGTASAAARGSLEPDLVFAGLLHAAYMQGAWDDRQGRRVRAGRDQTVVATIGPRAEAIVAEYTTAPWTAEIIQSYRTDPDSLAPKTRDVVLVRIANECDEHLDGGVATTGKAGSPHTTPDAVHELQQLAEQLGHPALGRLLEEISDDAKDADIGLPADRSRSRTLSSPTTTTGTAGVRNTLARWIAPD